MMEKISPALHSTCVYLHVNFIKREIFYVGIGESNRANSTSGRSKWWYRTVKKYDYDVVVIHENLSWNDACILEIKYIAQVGRKDKKLGPLVNHTDGGEGGNGYHHTEKAKKKIGKTHKDKPKSEEHKAKLSLIKKDVPLTKEHIANMILGRVNYKPTQETKDKIGNANRNRKLPPKSLEARMKSSLALKDKPKSKEHKQNIRLAKKGKYMGEESSQYGTCWITKEGINKKIKKEELQSYLTLGWVPGRGTWKSGWKGKTNSEYVDNSETPSPDE